MSQEKAQLIAPIGIMTVSGMTATGVITATSFTGNVVGSAKSLVNGSNVTVGVITATSFDGALTGNIQRLADSAPDINVGVSTATSFVGNLTGSVTDLTSAPNITVGVVTATTFEGPVTGNIRGNITGNVTGVATGNVTGDVDGDITGNVTGTIAGNVTGNVTGNATGIAAGLAQGGLGINYNGGWTGAGTSQIQAGVVTATTFYGDGSNLSGVSAGPTTQQSIGITSAATTIDLSNGNVIYATQSATTVVSLANTENGYVYFIRKDDNSGNYRGITWPTGIGWSGGAAPNLVSNTGTNDVQVFTLLTRDMGVTWYGREVVRIDPTFGFFAVGANGGQGTLGQSANTNLSSPVQISGTTWSNVCGSGQNIIATKTDGTLWGWGDNSAGAGGANDRTQRSSPIQIGTRTAWNQGTVNMAGSSDGAFWVVDTSNQLWAWGDSLNSAYLGLGNVGPSGSRSSPCQIPGSWSKPFAGGQGPYGAIKNSNELWVWGNNEEGQLGQNNRTAYSSPRQIPGTWSQAAAGYHFTTMINTSGELWAVGRNTSGHLGLNNTTNYSSPVQVGTDNTWSLVQEKNSGFQAIKTDGSLWTWGGGGNGNIGNNTSGPTARYSSPVQVPGSWSSFGTQGAGRGGSAVIKTDGSLWTWGSNGWGQLGLNQQTPSYASPDGISSPTQVGSFTDCTRLAFWSNNMAYIRNP